MYFTTLRSFLLTIGVLFSYLSSHAQETTGAAFEISGSETLSIQSSILDRQYDLYVKFPPGYNSKENAVRLYPVIYLNDAGYNWLTAVGLTRAPFNHGGYESAILVGISYAKGVRGMDSRVQDYTPTKDLSWRRFDTGGGAQYLEFIKKEAIPFAESKYRIDSNRRTLVGHSLGGLFGAYVLLKEPGLFSNYILSSPSLWYHDQVIFQMESAVFDSSAVLTGRVFIGIGSTETPAINGRDHDMVGQAINFAKTLRSRGYKDLDVREVVYEDGTHLTTYPLALTEALRWLLPGDDVYGG